MEETKEYPVRGETLLALSKKYESFQSGLDEQIQNQNVPEEILAKQAANLYRGIEVDGVRLLEAVGGKIFVTNKAIKFKPHLMNIQTTPTEFPLDVIERIEREKTLGIVPNQMNIILKSGSRFRFVVNNRNKLINIIENAMKK